MIVLSYRINGAGFKRRFENFDAALAAIRKDVLEDNGIEVKVKLIPSTKQERAEIRSRVLGKLTAEERAALGLPE
jgi:hypothetical protein